ncbi:MAG TPA: type I methionyl aminopeptidase [Rectinemataceae bacterium]|nr:type I methionyl aminopeptidase [Rectinemataceae bacterium]
MTRLKNQDQIEEISKSCALLSRLFEEIIPLVRPGVTPRELDRFARSYIEKNGGTPSFLDYEGYPASLCVSPNEVVIHGIPDGKVLEEGDIVGLDCGINLKGYFSDAAITLPVGKVSEDADRLMRVTRECLDRALEAVKPGARIHDVSRAVYGHARANGYGVVRQYCGHAVGFDVHEDPQIPNYVGPGANPRIVPGMVLAIEPMVNLGTGDVKVLADDWTVVTLDRGLSAHYEHTVAVNHDGSVKVLTAWSYPN